jgi:hypothetical protein
MPALWRAERLLNLPILQLSEVTKLDFLDAKNSFASKSVFSFQVVRFVASSEYAFTEVAGSLWCVSSYLFLYVYHLPLNTFPSIITVHAESQRTTALLSGVF